MQTEPTHLIDRTRRLWLNTEFEWGRRDCLLSVADYVLDLTGVDVAEVWRGTYDSKEAAKALTDAQGGVLAFAQNAMTAYGFGVSDRGLGRPVVVDMFGTEIAGIDLGHRVMMRLHGRGVVEFPAPVLRAWSPIVAV